MLCLAIHSYFLFLSSRFISDRVNEFSDEDEEIEFSSGEYDPNNIGGNGPGVSADHHLTGYDAKRDYAMKRDLRKYRKIDPTENDGEVDDGALGANPADSDSEFENLKVKGSSRVKISHVSTNKCQQITQNIRP